MLCVGCGETQVEVQPQQKVLRSCCERSCRVELRLQGARGQRSGTLGDLPFHMHCPNDFSDSAAHSSHAIQRCSIQCTVLA